MSRLFYLFAEQPERVRSFFPLSHGLSRVGNLGTPGGIIHGVRQACPAMEGCPPVSMAPMQPCITAFFAGVAWAHSTAFLWNPQKRRAMMGGYRCASKPGEPPRARSRKGSFPPRRTREEKIEFKIPCAPRRRRKASDPDARGRPIGRLQKSGHAFGPIARSQRPLGGSWLRRGPYVMITTFASRENRKGHDYMRATQKAESESWQAKTAFCS